jgi:hypothetical protein
MHPSALKREKFPNVEQFQHMWPPARPGYQTTFRATFQNFSPSIPPAVAWRALEDMNFPVWFTKSMANSIRPLDYYASADKRDWAYPGEITIFFTDRRVFTVLRDSGTRICRNLNPFCGGKVCRFTTSNNKVFPTYACPIHQVEVLIDFQSRDNFDAIQTSLLAMSTRRVQESAGAQGDYVQVVSDGRASTVPIRQPPRDPVERQNASPKRNRGELDHGATVKVTFEDSSDIFRGAISAMAEERLYAAWLQAAAALEYVDGLLPKARVGRSDDDSMYEEGEVVDNTALFSTEDNPMINEQRRAQVKLCAMQQAYGRESGTTRSISSYASKWQMGNVARGDSGVRSQSYVGAVGNHGAGGTTLTVSSQVQGRHVGLDDLQNSNGETGLDLTDV